MKTKPKTEIQYVSPAATEVHPLLVQTAMLSDAIKYLKKNRDADKEELEQREREEAAIYESIAAVGVQEPLYAVLSPSGVWLVCDGRHRRQYAIKAGLELIPIIQIREEDARDVILRQNGKRRSQTKSQIAWLAVSIYPEVCDNKPGRRSNSQQCELPEGPGNSQQCELTRVWLASSVGVSPALIDLACDIWKKYKASRTSIGAKIAAGIPLNRIVPGEEGKKALPQEDGKIRRPAPSVPGLCRTLSTVSTQLKSWSDWDEDQRELAVSRAAEIFSGDNGSEFLGRVMSALETL